MLGICDSRTISEDVWEMLSSKALLPCSREAFFAYTGATPIQERSERRYHRFHLRSRAILYCGGCYHAIYTKDLSRMGVGFYSPVQLFPQDPITLWLPQKQPLELHVSRCRRVGKSCYECGSLFRVGTRKKESQKTYLMETN